MICEIQFLIKFLLKAKKLGHKYYNIKRKELFINSINNIVYNENGNYQNYKNKILTLINDNNMEQLSYQLFLKPNIVLSMICKESTSVWNINSDVPLLYHIGRKQHIKMFELFMDCLLHFNQTYLQSNSNDNAFLKQYLNFNHCNMPIIWLNNFVKWLIYMIV